MKRSAKQILFTFFLGMVLPSLIFSIYIRNQPKNKQLATTPETTQTHETTLFQTQPVTKPEKKETLPVLMQNGTVEEMELNAYLTGVVLREMPANFAVEALKAQAVVARTYTLQKLPNSKHKDAVVCTDASCCQGYCSEDEYIAGGGSREELKKVQTAVFATDGLVITYNGSLIEATYFSCSGGKTEDAAAVWGQDVPYLQATDSPGEEKAAHYTDTVTYTTKEFCQMLGVNFTGPSAGWVESITYTDGGGIDKMRLCGKTFSGTQLRKLLNLRSTAFILTALGDTITITTKGYGHRVGMSQYGADAMAVKGSDFEEILAHYYKDTELTNYPS